MKFADIKNDVAFRKIFGNKKKTKILISFLNAVLQLEGLQRIESVKIENPYQFPRIAGEKSSIIDVRATDESGRQFVIEMQVAEADGFDKRVQYYASRDYSMQIDTGEDYTKLKPTVFIGILNFSYFSGADYLSYHSLVWSSKTVGDDFKNPHQHVVLGLGKALASGISLILSVLQIHLFGSTEFLIFNCPFLIAI